MDRQVGSTLTGVGVVQKKKILVSLWNLIPTVQLISRYFIKLSPK